MRQRTAKQAPLLTVNQDSPDQTKEDAEESTVQGSTGEGSSGGNSLPGEWMWKSPPPPWPCIQSPSRFVCAFFLAAIICVTEGIRLSMPKEESPKWTSRLLQAFWSQFSGYCTLLAVGPNNTTYHSTGAWTGASIVIG